MNWLAKINLPIVVRRLGTFKSSLLLFSTIALCLYVGYRIGNYFHGYQEQIISKQKQRLDELYELHNESLKRIHTLEVELEVERLANEKAQQTIKGMEEQHFSVKKELAFYQKVMAPEKQADGLIIDLVKLTPTESPNHFRFDVTLVQQTLKKRFATGYLELIVAGSQNNKRQKVNLSKDKQLTQKQLSFSLKYFQQIDGEFTLPSGFIPESLFVKAVLPKGRWQKHHELNQEFLWSDLIKVP